MMRNCLTLRKKKRKKAFRIRYGLALLMPGMTPAEAFVKILLDPSLPTETLFRVPRLFILGRTFLPRPQPSTRIPPRGKQVKKTKLPANRLILSMRLVYRVSTLITITTTNAETMMMITNAGIQ
jgi:hypothetical protein